MSEGGVLTVTVFGARELDAKASSKFKAYAVVRFGKRVFTTSVMSSNEPRWEEAFVCGAVPENDATVVVEVYKAKKRGHDLMLGRVVTRLNDVEPGRHHRYWRRLQHKTRNVDVKGELELGVLVEGQYPAIVPRSTNQKDLLLDEIISSEQAYLRNLDFISATHSGLRSNGLMNEREMQGVFGNLDSIRGANLMFYKDLMLVQAKEGDRAMGFCQQFLNIAPVFQMYGVYCHIFETAQARLFELRSERPKLEDYFKSLKPDEFGLASTLDISSSLVTPIQRICKYPLLFKELLKMSKKAGVVEEDIAKIETTLDKADGLARIVNQKKRDAEDQEKMVAISRSLLDCDGLELLQPTRTLILESECTMTVDGIKTTVYIFLFSDILVVTEAGTEKVNKRESKRIGNNTVDAFYTLQWHARVADLKLEEADWAPDAVVVWYLGQCCTFRLPQADVEKFVAHVNDVVEREGTSQGSTVARQPRPGDDPKVLFNQARYAVKMMKAVELKNGMKTIESILARGGDPNCPNEEGWTVLHLAAFHGRADMVKLLLENDANPNLMEKNGKTPLQLATEAERKDCSLILAAYVLSMDGGTEGGAMGLLDGMSEDAKEAVAGVQDAPQDSAAPVEPAEKPGDAQGDAAVDVAANVQEEEPIESAATVGGPPDVPAVEEEVSSPAAAEPQIDVEALFHELASLKDMYEGVVEERDGLQVQLVDLNESKLKVAALEADLTDVREHVRAVQEENESLAAKNATVTAAAEAARKDLGADQAVLATKLADITAQHTELLAKHEEIVRVKTEAEAAHLAEMEDLVAERDSMKALLEDQRNDLALLKENFDILKDLHENMKLEYEENAEEMAEELREIEEHCEELESQFGENLVELEEKVKAARRVRFDESVAERKKKSSKESKKIYNKTWSGGSMKAAVSRMLDEGSSSDDEDGERYVDERVHMSWKKESEKQAMKRVRIPRLYWCSDEATGQFQYQEVTNWTQASLNNDDVMILDAWDVVFVWVGQFCTELERKGAKEAAHNFISTSMEPRPDTTIEFILAGREPEAFIKLFPIWNATWKVALKVAFSKFDKAGDGRVTRSAFEAMCKAVEGRDVPPFSDLFKEGSEQKDSISDQSLVGASPAWKEFFIFAAEQVEKMPEEKTKPTTSVQMKQATAAPVTIRTSKTKNSKGARCPKAGRSYFKAHAFRPTQCCHCFKREEEHKEEE